MKTLVNIKKNLLFVLALSLSLISSFSVLAQPIELRFSHEGSEDSPKGLMATKFKELLDQRLGSDVVNVTIHANGTLFSDDKIGAAITKGQAELGAPAISQVKKYSKRLQVFEIPFLFISPEAAENFTKSEYATRIIRLLRSKGIEGLGFLNNGMKQLSANKSIQVPSDFKDLRFSVMDKGVLEAQFKQINAVPLKTPISKVFELLEKKQIDGQENTWSNIYTNKFYEHQPYIIESNHGYLGSMIISSTKFWDSIPSTIKPTINITLDEAIAYGNELANKKANDDKQNIIRTKASKIHTLTVEERQMWISAMQPVWKKFQDVIGSELMQAAASSR